jgi:ppGpp synthetase/RelA/SpoT-type nucleotidyltranferase
VPTKADTPKLDGATIRTLSSRSRAGIKKAKTRFANLPKAQRETKRQKYLSKMVGTLEGLQAALDKGKLEGTVRKHVLVAKAFLAKHDANFQPSVERMTQAIHDAGVTDISVTGRTKVLESTLGKLIRKPKYKSADNLQDGTGMRVVCKSVQDVRKAVQGVRDNFEVVEEDNYIDTPQGDYRSHHLIVRDSDGLQKEIQIRTGNQNTWADWFHDVYKPMTPKQLEAAEQHGEVLGDYAGAMADYFWQVDQGKDPGAPPPCPQAVAETPFGCLS